MNLLSAHAHALMYAIALFYYARNNKNIMQITIDLLGNPSTAAVYQYRTNST